MKYVKAHRHDDMMYNTLMIVCTKNCIYDLFNVQPRSILNVCMHGCDVRLHHYSFFFFFACSARAIHFVYTIIACYVRLIPTERIVRMRMLYVTYTCTFKLTNSDFSFTVRYSIRPSCARVKL